MTPLVSAKLIESTEWKYLSLIDPTMKGALFIGALVALVTYGITVLQVHVFFHTPFIERKLNVISNPVVIFLLYVVSKR